MPAHGQPVHITPVQRIAFTMALAVGSRAIHLRDRLLGRIQQPIAQSSSILTPLSIASGRNRLDAAFVAPATGAAKAAVLICHGIGEVVEQWVPIQQRLAAQGIASLVFDYSGYGRSTGWPAPAQLEQDAIAAYTQLSQLVSIPISLLGFSLGSGVAPAILDRVEAHRLVLCEGFTSFRSASQRVGVPPFFKALVAPVFDAETALCSHAAPVLVVHSTHDRLFPIAMGEQLAGWCGARGRLHTVEGLHHNEPFYKPTDVYWGPIATFLIEGHSPQAAGI